jgi:hypothetical protein
MALLPEIVYNALQELKSPAVFSTTGKDGTPNACWVALFEFKSQDSLLINDSVFSSKGSILILTDKFKAYQIKGSLVYHTDGPLFDYMRAHVEEIHARVAAVELKVEEVWEGEKKLA